MDSKTTAYHKQIRRSLGELYEHMENGLLGWMAPDHFVETEHFTPEQEDSIWAVMAIEEEWILDPELRKEISLVKFED